MPVAVFPSKQRARNACVEHGADLTRAVIHESQTSSYACEVLPRNGVRIDRARTCFASLPPTVADLASYAVFRSRVSPVRRGLSGLRDRRHSRSGHHDADCPAVLGPVKPLRFAPPAHAAIGLDSASAAPGDSQLRDGHWNGPQMGSISNSENHSSSERRDGAIMRIQGNADRRSRRRARRRARHDHDRETLRIFVRILARQAVRESFARSLHAHRA